MIEFTFNTDFMIWAIMNDVKYLSLINGLFSSKTDIMIEEDIFSAFKLLNLSNENFDKLLFNLEDIPMELTGAKIGARECTSKGVLRNLGVVELDSEIVILKCTVIVQRNSVYVLDKELDIKTENFSNELKELSSLPKKFDLRETI